MIKLSDLKAARTKMEPGPYTHESCAPPAGAVNIRENRCACDDPTAIGIEATRAAADILIEIAVAALVWCEAGMRRDEELRLMNEAKNSDDYCTASTLLPLIGGDRDAALSRLTAALSKVQP